MAIFRRRPRAAEWTAPPIPATPIGAVVTGQPVTIDGRVRRVKVQPRAGVPTLEVVVADETGELSVVFLGRRRITGIDVGTRLALTGVAHAADRHLRVLNPTYTLR